MIEKTPWGWRYPSGREVCKLTSKGGMDEYRRRVEEMRLRQDKKCCLCGLKLSKNDATFEHQDGRGMGAGSRDDRIEIDGRPYNGAAHFACNSKKGSRRIDYTEFYEAP